MGKRLAFIVSVSASFILLTSFAGAKVTKGKDSNLPFDPATIKEIITHRILPDGNTNSGYLAKNPFYLARFQGKGLTFFPLKDKGAKIDDFCNIELGLDRVVSKEKVIFTADPCKSKPSSIIDNHITYLISPEIKEVYLAKENGVEQLFTISRPLTQKNQDIRLEIYVNTPLKGKTQGDSIAFFTPSGKKAIGYGEVTVFDARGETITFSPEFTGDQIVITIPHSFLNKARFPITVDPLINNDFPICNEATADQWVPAVAFDGTNYLVVWEDWRNATRDIYGQMVSPAGVLQGGNFPICNAAAGQLDPAVAFDGTNYLVVWRDGRNATTDIYGQRVSPAGVLQGGNFPICNAAAGQLDPAVAFDGTNYLVVWRDGRNATSDIYGQRVSPAGGLLGGNFFICNEATALQRNPAVTFDGTNYLVVWEDRRNATQDIYGQFVGPNPLQVDFASASGTGNMTLQTDNGNFRQVWFMAEGACACGNLAGFNFDHGLARFIIDGPGAGFAANVTITYPGNIPATTTYWKCGPNAGPGWYDFSGTGNVGDNDGDNQLILALTDGVFPGDDDGLANVIIDDQGGPGWPAPPGTPVPTMTEWGMLIFIVLMALVSLFYLKRGRPSGRKAG